MLPTLNTIPGVNPAPPQGVSPARKSTFRPRAASAFLTVLAALLLAAPAPVSAQQLPANLPRITQAIDPSRMTTLKGNVHPLARPEFDHGAAAAGLPMRRMLMVLKRSDAQEHALKTLIDEQQDKRSGSYRQWLTPATLGQSFGPVDSDVQAITGWLQSQGFQIGSVSKSRMFIEFTGTAGQVASTFHTAIHSYVVNGEQHYANNVDPQIPTALTPVVAGIASLNNFPRRPANHFMGTFVKDKNTGKVTQLSGPRPGFTYPTGNPNNPTDYLVGPYDLATIYNIQSLWNAGVDGTGQTIAIVGQTDINVADAHNFRQIFGLPVNDPVVITNGIDPGFTGDEGEADIDTQWSGAVAKNATIDFVTSATTETTSGIDLSALYIIDNNLAPVMSESYGECELGLGTNGNNFYYSLWEQAAAQGITVLVSTGDQGSASCDYGVTGEPNSQGAQYGVAVSGISSTPYNIAVGGTDFDQLGSTSANNPANFWNTTNNSMTQASAKGYIPETTWNNSCTNAAFAGVTGTTDPIQNCNDSNVASTYLGLGVTGGTGGPSSCIQSDQSSPASCQGGYAKPSWQVGSINDNVRDSPDISLFASNGFAGSFYVVCDQDANSPSGQPCGLTTLGATFQGFGGTSVAAPAVAGIFSLLNQKLGARVGNANYALYNLAASQSASSCNSTNGPGASCIFNDVTSGTISQPCLANSPNCLSNQGGSFGVLVSDDGTGYNTPDSSGYPGDLAWNTAVGYDYATGLGSVNASNLVNMYSSANFISSSTNLALSNTTFVHGTPVNATVKVTSTTGTPSGDVSINGGAANASVGFLTLNGGTAQGSINSLPGGSYNVIAHYGGNNDGTNLFSGSDSNPVGVTVSPESSTTTLKTLLYNPLNNTLTPVTSAPYGSGFFARADVRGTSGNGTATGSVSITDNSTALTGSPFKLNSTGDTESQNYVPSSVGVHALSGVYSGDPSFTASTGTATLTITQATPTVTASASSSTINPGMSITLTAVVDTTSFASGPTGTVQFASNGVLIGAPVPVTGGSDSNGFPQATATLTTTALTTLGSNSITADYSGDANFAVTASPAVVVTVTTGPITTSFTVAGTAVSVAAGATTGNTSTVSITPSNGFTGAVALSATLTTQPAGAQDLPTIAFTASSVTVSGSSAVTTTATIGTTAATSGALAYPPTGHHTPAHWYEAAGGAALACVFFFGIPARRRSWRTMLGLLIVLVTLAGAGCGGGGGGGNNGNPGTTSGTYVFTVTGTSGTTSKTGTISVTVQ